MLVVFLKKKHLKLLFLFLFFFLCNPFLAESILQDIPAQDLTYQRKVFPSGFVLITHEDFSHPVASLHLIVRTGSIYEDLRTNGIAHFYEHLFFKGTNKRNAFQMKREVETLGGEMNGTTYKDFTEYYINIPSFFASQGIDLLMDAFLNAVLLPEEIEKERKVVIEEINLNKQNPHRILMDLFYENLYLEHPYRAPVGGSSTTISRITRDDLLVFKDKFYNPANAALVVVGAMKAKDVEAQVSGILKDVAYKPLVLPSIPKESVHTKSRKKVEYQEVDKAYLVIGHIVTGLDTPEDVYPLDILAFILGQGSGSRLDRIIKEEKKLVSEISANYQTVRYPGSLEIMALLPHENVEGSEKSILEELKSIKDGNIKDNELERAKRLLEGMYTMGHETMGGTGGTLAHYEGHGHIEFVKDYIENIQKVTVSDIVRVAKKYIQNNFTEVLILPKKIEPKKIEKEKKTKDAKDAKRE